MNKLFGSTFVLSTFQYFTIANDYNPHLFKPTPIRSGPWIQMTKGEVWPKPKLQVKKNQALLVESLELQYEVRLVAKDPSHYEPNLIDIRFTVKRSC